MSMGGESSHAQPYRARGIRQTPKVPIGKMAWCIRERKRLTLLGYTVDRVPEHYVDREQIAATARAAKGKDNGKGKVKGKCNNKGGKGTGAPASDSAGG